MLKTLPIIPSSTSQKNYPCIILILFSYHYLLFLFYSFCFIVLCIDHDIQRNMDLIHNFVVAIV